MTKLTDGSGNLIEMLRAKNLMIRMTSHKVAIYQLQNTA
jgi:hypothetical protein